MPSRRRRPAPPPPPLSDVERFAQSVRESEMAARRAREAEQERKAEAQRREREAAEQAERLASAKRAHQVAVERLKEANRSGKGKAAAEIAWRHAKADLLELETGQRPSWARETSDVTS